MGFDATLKEKGKDPSSGRMGIHEEFDWLRDMEMLSKNKGL
jgi:hypothetical protein